MSSALILVLSSLLALGSHAGPCGVDDVRDTLRARGAPVQAVTTDGAGGVFVFLGREARIEALAWVARLPGGQIVSSRGDAVEQRGQARTWEPELRTVYDTLAEPAMERCPQLSLPAGGRQDVGPVLDGLRRIVGPPNGPAPETPAWASPPVVAWLALLEVLALVGLLVVQAARGLRARPREALGLLALVVGAVAVRALATTRHPVGAANGDFTHILHAVTWLRDGFGPDFGAAYPPAYRVLLTAVYAVTGPSLVVGYWLTTLVGALVAVPAALLARRLAGPAGALFAGLTLATYPAAVYFSNGVDLSMPSAFLLVLAFERLLAAAERPGVLPIATWALAMVLFTQSRLEAAGLALPVAAAQAAMLVGARSPGLTRRVAPAAALALGLTLPYAGFLWTHAADLGKAGDALPLLAIGAGALALASVAWVVADRRLGRTERAALAGPLLLSLGALVLLAVVVVRSSGNAFLPASQVVPEFPFVRYHVEQGPLRFVDHAGLRFFLLDPGIFPLALLIPWAWSLAPALGPGRRRLPLVPLLLLGLPLVAWLATSRTHTGIVLAEGLRLHAAFAGLVAVSIGVGAARMLAWVGRGVSRSAAGAMVLVAVLAPVGTHHGLLADGESTPQAEARFVEAIVDRLPDGATVLLPDDAIDMSEELLGVRHVYEVFRTDHLWKALVGVSSKRLTVVPLSAFLELPLPVDGPIVAALGLDCARARRPEPVNPSCRRLRRLLTTPPLLEQQVANRTYESLGLPWFQPSTPTITFSVLPVTPSDVAALRSHAASRLVKDSVGPVY